MRSYKEHLLTQLLILLNTDNHPHAKRLLEFVQTVPAQIPEMSQSIYHERYNPVQLDPPIFKKRPSKPWEYGQQELTTHFQSDYRHYTERLELCLQFCTAIGRHTSTALVEKYSTRLLKEGSVAKWIIFFMARHF